MVEPGYHKAPSKVVSIPVHFVGLKCTGTEFATKIQRVLRDFLVRNTLRKIAAMRVELERVTSHFSGVTERIESEVRVKVMKLKREQRERMRLYETIMNLLLKLDFVKVLLHYSGLRECRKSLINKAIALQEFLDQVTILHFEEKEGECVGEENCLVEEEKSSGVETFKSGEGECVGEDNCLVKEEEDDGIETLRNGEVEKEKGRCMEEESIGLGTRLVEEEEGENRCEEQEEEDEEIEALNNEDVEEEDSEGGRGFVGEKYLVKEKDGEGKKRELLLEKMVEDNQKMMEMMVQLFQRNEMQTTLLASLKQRVEPLERALACDKLRRKKKRKDDAKNKQNHPKNGFI
ncbi:neurofilament medium polypeptide-like [Glycine soja]|uniref:BAG domain-containing protein n=1 Tax=Glycine soja TaxID=3848 RepID=A0A445LM03_GLYSO|nr:neurofilament medium polypeptide-like [Glycine soja]RZC24204.1 hypothetical protein D0Y65_003455 [Glycine soja]